MKRLFISSLIFILILNSSYALFDTDDFIYIKRGNNITTYINNTYNITPNSIECGLNDYLFNVSIDSTGDLGGVCRADQDTTYSENSPYLTLVGTIFGFDESKLNTTITSYTNKKGNVSGSGTANYIPKWLNGQNLTNSVISNTANMVNVNGNLTMQGRILAGGVKPTSFPSYLDQRIVIGANTQKAQIMTFIKNTTESSADTSFAGFDFEEPNGNLLGYMVSTSANYPTTGLFTPKSITFQSFQGDMGFLTRETYGIPGDIFFATNGYTASQERMRIKSNGNIGIGTSTPQNKLDVEGACAVGASYSGTNTAPSNGCIIQGNVGIGTNNPSQKLHVVGNTIISQNLTVDTNTLFVNSQNARVGIGTLTPNAKLQINGNMTVGNTTGYTKFANDGTMTMHGTARKHMEDAIFAVRTTKGVSAPTEVQFQIGVNSTMLGEALSFSKVSQQDAYFTYHVPEDIDNSENLTFHLMWKPGDAWTTGYYIWKLEYIVKGEFDNSTISTSTIIYMNVTPTNNDNFIETEFTTGIDADGQETITCHFYRDTSNDNADDVGLIRFYEFERVVNRQGE